jgi:hypothetical protein
MGFSSDASNNAFGEEMSLQHDAAFCVQSIVFGNSSLKEGT